MKQVLLILFLGFLSGNIFAADSYKIWALNGSSFTGDNIVFDKDTVMITGSRGVKKIPTMYIEKIQFKSKNKKNVIDFMSSQKFAREIHEIKKSQRKGATGIVYIGVILTATFIYSIVLGISASN